MEENTKLWCAMGLQVITMLLVIGMVWTHNIQIQEANDRLIKCKEICNDTIYLITTYQKEVIELMSEEINNQTSHIRSLEIDRTRLINELSLEYKNHNTLNIAYNQIKKEKGLLNPTYKELKDFVRKDKTNYKNYGDDYDCSEFSYEFVRNFAKIGYDSGTVEINLNIEDDEECGHTIVAINTTDRGLIYLEPQDDSIFEDMNLGEDYCNLADWNCQWTITKISSKYELRV